MFTSVVKVLQIAMPRHYSILEQKPLPGYCSQMVIHLKFVMYKFCIFFTLGRNIQWLVVLLLLVFILLLLLKFVFGCFLYSLIVRDFKLFNFSIFSIVVSRFECLIRD